MGKRSSATSTFKKERRNKRKKVEHKRKMEQRKQRGLAVTQLENTFFLCDHKRPVYKFFEKEEYANALARGIVHLGTLDTYRASEDAEQGDSKEAHETYLSGYFQGDSNDPEFVEKARRSGVDVVDSYGTTISGCSNTVSIADAYALCTTTEFSPENMSEKIGTKYCVKIKDPRKFFNIVSRKLDSIYPIHEGAIGRIKYADRNYTGLDQPPGPLGFVKPSFPYEKQKEFRFLWIMKNTGKLEPFQIDCPELSKLCERIL